MPMILGIFKTTNKMAFKINVSHKGKTIKFETDSEELIDKVIGEKIPGKEISKDLDGYQLEITGTSDKAGFPGIKEYKGPNLRRVLLTYGIGMKSKPKGLKKKKPRANPGLRLRKTIRGDTISADTVQINTKVIKEGAKKFEEMVPKKEPKEKPATPVAQ